MLATEETPRSLLQDGRGIDHLIVAVRNLPSSTDDYSKRLGFTIIPGGRHPTGTENTIAGFEDQTYLELLSQYDPSQDESLCSFLEKHEGVAAVGLQTASAEQSARFLRSRGLEPKTGEGSIKLEGMEGPPPVFWRWVDINDGTALGNSIFLIEYTPARMEYREKHPEQYGQTSHQNTGKNLSKVWIAVRGLEEAAKRYQHIGLTRKLTLDLPWLNAKGLELQAGNGSILLLAPTGDKGETVRFLAQRGEGVIGASIEVASLATCERSLKQSKIDTQTQTGPDQTSLMVHAHGTHGLFLEFFQKIGRK